MLGFGTLVVASSLMALPAGGAGPPKTTLAELNAMVKAGNYHLIRKLKVGYEIEAVGVVRTVGDTPAGASPVLALADGNDDNKWSGVLHNLPKDHGLRGGDRVKFRALILDEAYMLLQLWTYTWIKLPPVVVERPAPLKPVDPAPKPTTTTGPLLAGKWLLTMASGFEYEAALEPAGEPGLYRLVCGADNLQGVYELKGQKLTLVETTHKFLKGMAWDVKNNNAIVLTSQPDTSHVGSDYRGATLGRQKQAAPRR